MTFRQEIIGDCRLILGDCREVLKTLGKVDAVVTSPPYGLQRDYRNKITDWRSLVSGALCSVNGTYEIQFLINLGLIHQSGRVERYWDALIEDMEESGFRLFGWYVWDQMSGMAGDWNGRFAPSFEFVFHFNSTAVPLNKTKPTLGGKIHGPNLKKKDGTASGQSHDGRAVQPFKVPDSVIRTPRETSAEYSEHPARYPERFAKELVEPVTQFGSTVLDPFMGSGTTGVACAKLGRKFIGIEIDPGYFDIACRRIEQAYKQPDLFIEKPAHAKQEALL